MGSHATILDIIEAACTYGLPILGAIISYKFSSRRQERAKKLGEFHETGIHSVTVKADDGSQEVRHLTGVTNDTASFLQWLMDTVDAEKEHSRAQDQTISEQGKVIDRLESNLDRAHTALRTVHKWIRDGKKPPDPKWPTWLKEEEAN